MSLVQHLALQSVLPMASSLVHCSVHQWLVTPMAMLLGQSMVPMMAHY
jgi:hypothetical protein